MIALHEIFPTAPPNGSDQPTHAPSAFFSLLEYLFEEAALLIAPLWYLGPWNDVQQLLDAADNFLLTLGRADQVGVLNAHARVGESAARLALRGGASLHEQGHTAISQALYDELDELNDEYEARFGFRFVFFVAGRPLHEFPVMIRSHLVADPRSELTRGLTAVVAIARSRVRDLE